MYRLHSGGTRVNIPSASGADNNVLGTFQDALGRHDESNSRPVSPATLVAWQAYAEAHPVTAAAVASAALSEPASEQAAAVRAVVEGLKGQEVVAWLRRGGYETGSPPQLPGTSTQPLRFGSIIVDPNQVTVTSERSRRHDRNYNQRTLEFERYITRPFAFTTHYPVISELSQSRGVPIDRLVQAMLADRSTAPEALVRMGALPPTHFDQDPKLQYRFVTQSPPSAQNARYADFAEATAQIATRLYGQGTRSELVASFIAESKQHFQIQEAASTKPVEFYNCKQSAAGGINPTVLVAESRSKFGGANYATAAQGIIDRVIRFHERAEVFEFEALDGIEALTQTLKQRERDGVMTRGPGSAPLSQTMIDALNARPLYAESNVPVLDGNIIRLKIETPHGVGGAVYVAELVRTRVRVHLEWVQIPPRYRLEIVLDQGTAAIGPNGPMRQAITQAAHREIDGLLNNRSASVQPETMQKLAGAWYDLSATSGGWVGGGAGTNHIQLASAYAHLTGKPMPRLSGPIDLYAATLSRDEFVQAFLAGELFRDGKSVLRDIGLEPGLSPKISLPRFV